MSLTFRDDRSDSETKRRKAGKGAYEKVNGKQRLFSRKLNTTYIKSSIINSFSGDPHYANDLHSRKQVFFHLLLAFHPFDGPFPLFAHSFSPSFLPRPVSKVSTHAISACTRSCS